MSGPTRGPVPGVGGTSAHERALALAAAAIDFRLSPQEQTALREHLATCASCTGAASRLRQDAASLVALPAHDAPAAVRDAVVRAAASRRLAARPSLGLAFAAVLLVAALAAGSFVAGALQLHGDDPVAPPSPLTAVRPTAPPSRTTAPPTAAPTPRHATPAPTPAAPSTSVHWASLGDITEGVGGRPMSLVLPRPGGGFVAFGSDRTTGDALVWLSADGAKWEAAPQPADVFDGRVPSSGGLGGPGLVVVGWDITVDNGKQRAIWTSADGRAWKKDPDPSGVLATTDADVRFNTGPAGMLAWTPAGKAWSSRDGSTWRPSTVASGMTDALVTADGFVAVGRDSGDVWLETSPNGRTWTEASRTALAGGDEPGAETAGDGSSLVWVGSTRWTQRADGSWQQVRGSSVPSVPRPSSVAGGVPGFLAMADAAGDGAQRGLVASSDGVTWQSVAGQAPGTAAADSARPPIAMVPDATGWTVFLRAGGRVTAWRIGP